MQGTANSPEVAQWVERVARNASGERLAQWGYTLYFVLFAVGVALLLAFSFLPDERTPDAADTASRRWLRRLSRARWYLAHSGAIILALLCCISQQTGVDERRGFIADQDKRYEKAIRQLAARKDKQEALRAEYLYIPQGNALTYMSLGNTSIAADYVWLLSLQYVSNSFRRGHKFDMLLRFYDTVLDLDPHWVEAAINAGKILSALEPNRYAVEKFYTNAILKNPDDWRLPYEAGRLFVVPPSNLALQADYSRRAVAWFNGVITRLKRRLEKTPASSPVAAGTTRQIKEIEDLVARLAVESGYYDAADELLWKAAHDETLPKAMRNAAATEWLNAHSLVIRTALQRAVDEHKKRTGAWPADLRPALGALKSVKMVPFDENGWPVDAFGFRIEYDPASGKVSSRGVNAKRTLQAASIMNALLDLYRSNNGGEAPRDLAVLQTFVRRFYGNPANPPGPAVLDALGADLNTIVSPLGTPWEYDPKAGKVVLPGYCNAKVLFRNARKIVGDEE
ncbi:MAG: hypothetical protein NTW87_20600 [Planctomycetota bacterium]|nr:hypothetical protein [Planctomycetota bacterium]